MTELFLYYIWQFQYFNKQNLQTVAGETLNILRTGLQNTDAGADFQQAQVEIHGKFWAGSIEIHLTNADWNLHKHHTNKQYNNVILHVVWNHETNKIAYREDGSMIPTLVLSDRVSPLLLDKYAQFISQKQLIPCQNYFKDVDKLKILSMLDNVLVQRLQRKAQIITDLLTENTGNWEETTYQILAQSFGFKVNSEAFLALAKSLPFKILTKHGDDLLDIEALVFGQSGLLTDLEIGDEYSKELTKRYFYLKYKYNLTPLEAQRWKFLRMRPANFPTIRLAQFSMLIHSVMQVQQSFFTSFIHTNTAKELQKILQISASDYWHAHYNFSKVSTRKMGNLGIDGVNILIINTIAPLLTAYSLQKDNDVYIEKAIKILEQLPAESNKITELWEDVGLSTKNAFDAQASIELYNEFCAKKRCLSCRIGICIIA